MSKRASPPVLGAFIVGGLLLIAVGIIAVGARGLFSQKSQLMLYFPTSVNGLRVGSAVKFNGVPIGQVRAIKLSLASADSALNVPVLVEIDDDLIATGSGDPIDLSDPLLVRSLVDRGLRGSLEIESLLTGMLYVGLSINPHAPPPVLRGPRGTLPEIPTVQTGFQKLAESLPQISRILDRFEGVASQVDAMLKKVDAGKINDSLLRTLADVQTVLQSPTITNTLVSIQDMANEFRLTATDLRGDLKPMVQQLSEVAAGADQTLAQFDRLLLDARRLVGDDSPMVGQLVSTLAEFQQTAIALRQLADFLQRNPSAILTGRDPSQGKNP